MGPNDLFAVMQTAMRVARETHLASFYDPEDPRIDVWDHWEGIFAQFRDDKSAPYLHIGIYYPKAKDGSGADVGHLYIVKNRLPIDQVGHPVEPPLSEGEIMGGPPCEWDAEPWKRNVDVDGNKILMTTD